MGQINMDKIGKTTSNSTKTDKSEKVKKAETQQKSEELIDNTSEKTENTKETDKEQTKEQKETGSKVVVRYISSGVWRDSDGELWANENKTKNILSERQYTKEQYDNREDIRFMVGYGAMKATVVE